MAYKPKAECTTAEWQAHLAKRRATYAASSCGDHPKRHKANCTPEEWAAYLVKNRAKYKKLSAKWRKEKPEVMKVADRRSHLKNNYGITPEQYDVVLNAQGGVCAICHRPPQSRHRLAVDHNHTNGANRGLLCSACNLAVGLIEMDPDWNEKALNYLALYVEQTVKEK